MKLKIINCLFIWVYFRLKKSFLLKFLVCCSIIPIFSSRRKRIPHKTPCSISILSFPIYFCHWVFTAIIWVKTLLIFDCHFDFQVPSQNQGKIFLYLQFFGTQIYSDFCELLSNSTIFVFLKPFLS